MHSGQSAEGKNLCLLHKGSPDISAIACVAVSVYCCIVYSTVLCGHLDYESILYEVLGRLECDFNMLGVWFTKF